VARCLNREETLSGPSVKSPNNFAEGQITPYGGLQHDSFCNQQRSQKEQQLDRGKKSSLTASHLPFKKGRLHGGNS